MAVYAWSDTHLGHNNIIKFRLGFNTVEEHTQFICDTLTSTLRPRDKIYLLGDNATTEEGFLTLMSAIPAGCQVFYMGGNHDFERNKELWRVVANHPSISHFGPSLHKDRTYKVWYSHAPIHPVELRGRPNVHGHVHDNTLDDPRYYNVSVDNCSRPVRLEAIRKHHSSGSMVPFSLNPLRGV